MNAEPPAEPAPREDGTRLRVKVAAMAAGGAVLMTVAWAGLLLSRAGRRIAGLPHRRAVLHQSLLGVEVGPLAMPVGCATGRTPASARGLPAVLTVVTYLLNAMARW